MMLSELFSRNPSNDKILDVICNNGRHYKNYTFIITGKPGPTGKTCLTTALRRNGFNAHDISEPMMSFMRLGEFEFKDDGNHIMELPDKCILIVLNAEIGGNNKC